MKVRTCDLRTGIQAARLDGGVAEPVHDTCIRCKPSHPSPSARQFRLPFNGLAPSELRRIFCSDEGAYVRFDHDLETMGPRGNRGPKGLSMLGWGSACPGHPHCSADPDFKRVKRRKRRNAFWQSGADRETRYTLEPAAARHPYQGADR